jgi:short subunit dehydrogenase-like uncharacterized protein
MVGARNLEKVQEFKCRKVRIDIHNQEELVKELAQYRVCINCVGPFRLYGKPIVEACVLAKTDYIDICGETEFIERMYHDYHALAVQNQVSLVPACGYDCVPADFFTFWIKSLFQERGATCTQVEFFVELLSGPSGLCGNATTFESAVLGFASAQNLRSLRKHRRRLQIAHPLQVASAPSYSATLQRYLFPLKVADVPIIKLGQEMVEQQKLESASTESYQIPTMAPVHIAGYFAFTSVLGVLFVSYIGLLLTLGSYLSWFRAWLIQYPQVFTLGFFSKLGPSEQQLRESSFRQTFFAKQLSPGKVERELVGIVEGPESGYVTTPHCIVSALKMLLEHRDKIPMGVLTPSVAFSNVSKEFKDELERGGIRFTIKSQTGFE